MKKKRIEKIVDVIPDVLDNQDDLDNLDDLDDLDDLREEPNSTPLRVVSNDITLGNRENPEEPLRFHIQGSFARSLASTFFLAYIARSNMSMLNAPMAAMTGLSQIAKSMLAIAPLISGMMMPIPISWLVHQNGGIYEIILMTCLSSGGMVTLSTIAAVADLSKIDSTNLTYAAIFVSNFFIGCATASTFLFIDTLKWAPKKKMVPPIQTLYNFFIDSASVTTPILILYLKYSGYFAPLIGFSFLSILGSFAATFLFKPSPYNQFKEKFSKRQARIYALEYGQLDELIGDQDTVSFKLILKENINVLFDRRAIPLIPTFLSAFGSACFTRLILPQVLVAGFGLQQHEAVITSSLAYLVAISTRPIAELIIRHWDKESGGIRVHLLGSILMIAGALALTNDIPNWALYLSLGTFNIGYGFNLVTPSSIAIAWSVPTNSLLKDFNPSNMFSLFGTLGTLGSIFFPFLLGLMVDGAGKDGYQYFFYVIVGLIAISAITMPIIDKHVRDKSSLGFCGRFGAFFTHRPNLVEEEAAPVRQHDENRVYLENFF
ncbi:MAG: MFS transporter [Legionella sp.]|nr:MAG: MFS transporter [Legionella sp.]